MSLVMFACICDVCGRRSEEYGSWPTCPDCMDDICPAHWVPDSYDPEKNSVLCLLCSVARDMEHVNAKAEGKQ